MKTVGRLAWFGIAAAALAGMALTTFSTRLGPGVGGDATIYITSARNLLAGRGLGLVEADGSFRLLPYSAPFFPLVLAALQAAGLEIVAAARWLNILLFGGLVVLAGAAAFSTSRSAWCGVGAAWLVAVSPILTPVYSWAMAEPLTMLLGFGGLWMMARQIDRPGGTWPLVMSAILTGLAALTRYSATAFAATVGLGWLLLARTSWRCRIIKGLVFGFIAALPSLIWILLQFSYTSGMASRAFEDAAGMSARLASFWPQFGDVLLSWLIPASWIDAPVYPHFLNTVFVWILGLTLVGLGWIYFRRLRKDTGRGASANAWPGLVVFFITIYILFILGVYFSTYPPITLDNRMFSPVHAGVLMLLPVLIDVLFANRRFAWLRTVPALVVFGLVLWYGWRDVRIVRQNYDEGLGYNSAAWRSSELIAWVRQAPAEMKIVTNETMAVLYLTGRAAYPLAEIYADQPLDLDTRYGSSGDDEGQMVFHEGGNPLVLFDSIYTQLESIYGEQAAQRVEALTKGLEEVMQGTDGKVFFAPH